MKTLRTSWSEHLASASSEEAQLALSLIVWPVEAPDPRLVDEWLRRRDEPSVPGTTFTHHTS